MYTLFLIMGLYAAIVAGLYRIGSPFFGCPLNYRVYTTQQACVSCAKHVIFTNLASNAPFLCNSSFCCTTTACVYLRTSPAPRPTHTPCTTHPWWSKTGVHHSQTSITTCRQISDNLHCSHLLADFTHHSQCNTTTQTTCW